MKKTAKTILSTTLVASLLAGAAVPVFAQPGGFGMERGEGPRMPIAFSNFDTDGDGAITQEEMDAKKTLRFTEMDANGDGQLSVEEMLAYQDKQDAERRKQRAERMVERLDTNDDGLISSEELAAREGNPGKGLFERADLDSDGKITEEEFKTAMAKFKKHRKAGGREGGRFGKQQH